jgi:hypothetical protein
MELIYPSSARPSIDDCRPVLLIYPISPSDCMLDTNVEPKLKPVTVDVRVSLSVLMYPRPYTVDVTCPVAVLKKVVVPMAITVDTRDAVLTYPKLPMP